MASPGPPPRVVLFRANAIDSDSRAKKFSITLARLGYEVYALSAEPDGPPGPERSLGVAGGPQVSVVPVPVGHLQRDLNLYKVAHRRRRQFRFVDWTSQDEYVTRVRELRTAMRLARTRAAVLRRPELDHASPPAQLRGVRLGLWAGRYLGYRTRLAVRIARWRAQWALNVGHRMAWRSWDALRQESALLATTRGVLPEIEDYANAFSPVLDALAPDVIHVHHPLVLGTAIRAARRRRAGGHRCFVVYDAREDFQGIPAQEQGHRRRHSVLVREEARYIRRVDAVVTVSEPITRTLAERYRLTRRPALVLNVPVDDAGHRPGTLAGPTVREVAGLAPGVPLLVYSGAVSRARGLEVMIDALVHLPGVHAAVVPVPHPHPMMGELIDRATSAGVADRLHFLPPVDQDHLLRYLSGADVGVIPLRTGSANIEQALPNKLFENLHAGLTMVTSDARLIAEFVREHDLGEVFADGDPADLARAVRRALDHPRDRHGAHRDALRRRFSWQGQEAAIRDLYATLVTPPTPDGIAVEPFGSLTVIPAAATVVPPARSGQQPAHVDGRST
ncbi:MAG: glycosyltransferase family 4 protein [Kineosporiaceae bacterium]